MNFRTLFVLGILSLALRGNSQEYDFHRINTPESLGQSYVYSIIQDQHGYIWIGTSEGLSVFDGFRVKSFTTKDSLADNFITSAISDGVNNWFGHRNGKISLYDGKVFRQVTPFSGDDSPVTHFAMDTRGNVWAGTLSGKFGKLGKDGFTSGFDAIKGQHSVYTFEFINEKEILAGTEAGLMQIIQAGSQGASEIVPVSSIPESKITAISKPDDGKGFLIATENDGIFRLRTDENRFIAEKIVTVPDFPFNSVQDICEDFEGNIWVGSFITGLLKLSPAQNSHYRISLFNVASGFVSDNTKTLLRDREGNIWCGSYGEGPIQVTPRLFSILEYDDNKYGNSVFSICSESQNLWLGTQRGLIQSDPQSGKVKKFFNRGSGLPEDTITTIKAGRKNELWIGTNKSGLYRLDISKGIVKKVRISDGVLENSISSIAADNEQVWAGTKKGLCNIKITSGKITWFTINQGGLPHNDVTSLYEDKNGILWVSTNSNVAAYIENGKVKRIPMNLGTGKNSIGAVVEDTSGGLWVVSKGNGVFAFMTDTTLHISKDQGLFSDYCYSIACDSNQSIWIGHKNGISRIRKSDNAIKTFSQIDGINGDFQLNQNAIIVDQDKRINFGTNKGLIRYDPAMEIPVQVPPALGLISVRVNDEEVSFDNNRIVLPPGSYKIRIEFLGVSLKEPGRVTYNYQLTGFEQSQETTKSTSVSYSHLSDGKYLFHLTAVSGDGAVSAEPLVLTILIQKPLWKQWWFWLVSLCILIGMVYLTMQWRLARLIAEKKLLEEKVHERTSEIERQKDEIERQRDTIELKNVSITSSINYASNIQQTLLAPPELFEKSLPNSFLLSRPKDIVSGDFYWLTERNGKVTFCVADCTGHGVPGAFMSLLGITLLNEIVKVHGISRSDAILKALDEKVVQSVLQYGQEHITKDGMDIGLCVIDPLKRKMQYSGGMHDLVIVSNGKLSAVRADRKSIGPSENWDGNFSFNEIDYRESDMIYLFSDGYQDQFGGEKNKKFLRSRFYDTLLEISPLPPKDQKEILETTLNWWMGDESQTDDITVLGVRLH